ncbi:PPE family protein [Mycobacterium uberis]|uniref:PPE family protein n=1 Tax=Mycobacterium uberis TaxID=2162698 RepID=A0A3E1HLN2_9MYCO|nr:hypothetical protein [Mycobacterium uberis]RFD27257.1 PPE family protein [Mycobacterium uberis]
MATNKIGQYAAEITELDEMYDQYTATDVEAMQCCEQSVHDVLRALLSRDEPPKVNVGLMIEVAWHDQ